MNAWGVLRIQFHCIVNILKYGSGGGDFITKYNKNHSHKTYRTNDLHLFMTYIPDTKLTEPLVSVILSPIKHAYANNISAFCKIKNTRSTFLIYYSRICI
jgi:hypothetical protein